MSVATKLHILLITTILGVGLYMFLLYKEIKMFERELADLRIKVQSVAAQLPSSATLNIDVVDDTHPTSCPIRTAPLADAISSVCPDIAVIADNLDDPSESMSVTSNEIKEILTNIQDIQEDVTDEPPSQHADDKPAGEEPATAPATTVPTKTHVDLENWASLSDEDITSMKYDDLRSIIRKRGLNGKGTKQELLSMVLSLKKEALSN